VFEGLHHTSYVVDYTENPDCLSHYTLEHVVNLPDKSSAVTLGELRQRAATDLGSEEVVLEFSRDVIDRLVCPKCGAQQEYFVPVGAVPYSEGPCRHCGAMRVVHTLSGFRGQPELANRTLDQLGLPLFDIVTARSPEAEISYCFAGDAAAVLGDLSEAPR
jgi:hypothetical protein